MRFYDARFDQAKGEDEQKQDERDDAHLLGLSLAPEPHHHHRQHFTPRTVEQDRRGELPQNDEEEENPADREGRPANTTKNRSTRTAKARSADPPTLRDIGRDPGE